MNWLDAAQAEVNAKFMPLTRLTGFVVSANQEAFTLPADLIMTEVVWHAKAVRTTLIYKTPKEFLKLKMVAQSATGYPQYFTEFEGRIYLWPMYASADQTSTASGAFTIATTQISVATITGFQIQGLVQASNGEIIQYTNTSTGTIKGCVRGYAGTTAASGADTGTLSQMSLQVLYRRQAASLATSLDSVDLPTIYERAIENWVLYLAYAAEGSQQKAEAQYQICQQEFQRLEYIGSRDEMGGPMRIADAL